MSRKPTYKNEGGIKPEREYISYYQGIATPCYNVRDLTRYLYDERKFNIDYISHFNLKESKLKSTDRVKVIQRVCATFFHELLEHIIDDVIENGTLFEFCDKNTWLEAIHRTNKNGKSWGTLSIEFKYTGQLKRQKAMRIFKKLPKTVVKLNYPRWKRLQEKKHMYRCFDERKDEIEDFKKARQTQLMQARYQREKKEKDALKLQERNSKT